MNVFWRTFKDERLALIIWVVQGVILSVLLVTVFPSFQGTDSIDELLQALPPFVRAMIGAHIQPMSTLNGFLTVELFSWIPLLGGIFGVTVCSASLSREIETHSIEVLLSLPVSRPKVVMAKYLAYCAHAVILSVAILLALLSTIGHMNLGDQADVVGYAWVAFQATFVYLAMGAISLFVSSAVREQRKAMGISAGIALTMYLLQIISFVHEALKTAACISVFHYFDASAILRLGHPEWMKVLHLCSFTLVFLVAAVIHFERRDIPA